MERRGVLTHHSRTDWNESTAIMCSIDCLIPMNVFTIIRTAPHTHKYEPHSELDPLIRALLSLRPLRTARVSSDSKLDSSIRLCKRDFLRGHKSIVAIAVHTHNQNVPALWIIDGCQSVCLTTFKCFHGGSKSNQNTHAHARAQLVVSLSSVVFCYDPRHSFLLMFARIQN